MWGKQGKLGTGMFQEVLLLMKSKVPLLSFRLPGDWGAVLRAESLGRPQKGRLLIGILPRLEEYLEAYMSSEFPH